MKLFFRKFGDGNSNGRPVIILHGLFGLSDNWQTLGKKFSEEGHEVYLADLRNHGNSPHSSVFNYNELSNDVLELINEERIIDPVIIGHSLGGKTGMQLALNHPEKIASIIIVDIAPRYYLPHHQHVLEGLFSVNFDNVTSRGEVDKLLSQKIPDAATRQFFMKGLYWKDKDKLDWKFNLNDIAANIDNVGQEIVLNNSFTKPALFISGEKSKYIAHEDFTDIKKMFPLAEILTAPNAGHWVHAENPDWFFKTVTEFLKNN